MNVKRIIALVLALVLALPFAAFAEDAEEPEIRIFTPKDGSVIGKSYNTQYLDGYAMVKITSVSSIDGMLITVTFPDGTENEGIYTEGALFVYALDLTQLYRSITNVEDAEAPAGEYVITVTMTSTGDSKSVRFTYEPDDESEKLSDEEKLRIVGERAKAEEDAGLLEEQTAISEAAEANKTEKERNGEELTIEEKADVLIHLGVLEEDFKSKLDDDTPLLRGEVVSAVLKIMGIESKSAEEAVFTDVPLDGQWADIVYTAYSLNVVNGQGDGTFAPNEEATFTQAVKMLVCALGYDPAAKANGGYPAGYMFQGTKIGLTKGIASKSDALVTAKQFTELLYNALDIPVMVMTEFSSDRGTTYSVNELITLRGLCGK